MLPLNPTGGLQPPRLGPAGGKRSDWFALGATGRSSEFSIGVAKALAEPEGKTAARCGRLNPDESDVNAGLVAFFHMRWTLKDY